MSGFVTPYTNLITSEHKDKPNFVAMVGAVCQPFADLINLGKQVPRIYDLDYAVGVQLDVLGQWVGVSRKQPLPIPDVYFSFDTAGLGFDSGVWKGPTDPVAGLVSLPDDYFRLVIKAKILNNHWNGSLADAYTFAGEVFSALGYTFSIQDPCDLTMALQLVGPAGPPPLVVALLTSGVFDIKPAGVFISSYIY